jgi:hypothetical protein
MKGLHKCSPFYFVGSFDKVKESQAFDWKSLAFFILACLQQPVLMIQLFHQNNFGSTTKEVEMITKQLLQVFRT